MLLLKIPPPPDETPPLQPVAGNLLEHFYRKHAGVGLGRFCGVASGERGNGCCPSYTRTLGGQSFLGQHT